MGFGQVVIGPPGSGKTVYCNGMSQFLQSIGRKVAIINLDPSNETIPYTPTINVQDLVDIEKVIESTDLGPNGSLLYCMEYLEKNLDWLKEEMDKYKDCYFIIDCPGQVELYTHYKIMSNILEAIGKWSVRLTVIQVFDSFYCKNPATFISVLLVSLSSMVRIELPHINVLSKMDLIEKEGQLDFQLEFYTEVLDLKYFHSFLERDPRLSKFANLNKAISEVVEDYGLVSFKPLNIMDKESVASLVKSIDKSNGYIYGGFEVNQSILELSERSTEWNFEKYQQVHEQYMKPSEKDTTLSIKEDFNEIDDFVNENDDEE